MTRLEYKKIQIATRKKCHDLLERVIAADVQSPPDLHYLWTFMQEKKQGIRELFSCDLLSGLFRL